MTEKTDLPAADLARRRPALARLGALAAVGLATLVGAGAAHAADAAPIDAFGPGSAAEARARDIARGVWGAEPCAGQVTVGWTDVTPKTNAMAIWGNPVDLYAAPALNDRCEIRFNPGVPFDWSKYCTVMVHEYGHLLGRGHSTDVHDVMYGFYEEPIAACVDRPARASVASPVQRRATTTRVSRSSRR
jgi:hypothetical protein